MYTLHGYMDRANRPKMIVLRFEGLTPETLILKPL